MNTKPLALRFHEKTIPEPNTGCLLWLGGCDGKGYAAIYVNGRTVPATHVALGLAGISVPPGKLACHTCDTPGCVEAAHLYVGSAAQNSADAVSRSRLRIPRVYWPASRERKRQVHAMAADGFRPFEIDRALGLKRGGSRYYLRRLVGNVKDLEL